MKTYRVRGRETLNSHGLLGNIVTLTIKNHGPHPAIGVFAEEWKRRGDQWHLYSNLDHTHTHVLAQAFDENGTVRIALVSGDRHGDFILEPGEAERIGIPIDRYAIEQLEDGIDADKSE